MMKEKTGGTYYEDLPVDERFGRLGILHAGMQLVRPGKGRLHCLFDAAADGRYCGRYGEH